MTNRLANENSTYLLQHKDNPVDWYPWGEEALKRARDENKPIFLSIGYAACHWCHVMEIESFEDENTAKLMNKFFINIKVDREERPDLDNIYMKAIVAITGQGGWPMSVFLTSDGEPFYGGTYFPPANRYGMPSFKDVLTSVAVSWKEKQEEVNKTSTNLTDHIRRSQINIELSNIKKDLLDKALISLAQSYDWKSGGWGKAPKFPQPMTIRFLLRKASKGDKLALKIATHALKVMAKGGIYDVIGGGFSRYSVDDKWLIPHFEKMLYDNAQLARVYLHGYLITKDPFFLQIVEETLNFVMRELTDDEGGFFSSLDADSEGEEGKFYTWTFDEISSLVTDQEDIELLIKAYGINQEGNFEGKIILQRVQDNEKLGEIFKINPSEINDRLKKILQSLFITREKRTRPGTDDKVLVSWNAWMSIAFSEAARYLGRDDYLEVAKKNIHFILENLFDKERVLRSWRNGKANHNAYLEDYASLILALLSLYQSDPDPSWFQSASKLTNDMIVNFKDLEFGFFDTRSDHENLLTRPKETQDNATPSGNSLASEALLMMSAYTGKGDWYDIATEMLGGLHEYLAIHPTSFSNWLCAFDFALGDIQELAIIGDLENEKTKELVGVAWESYRPNSIVASSSFPPPEGSPPLLFDRVMVDGKPSAYVCKNFFCLKPTTKSNELKKQLKI